MKIFTCVKCGSPIKLHVIKGYVHLTCPTCQTQYQLDAVSLKKIYADTVAVSGGGCWQQSALFAGKND